MLKQTSLALLLALAFLLNSIAPSRASQYQDELSALNDSPNFPVTAITSKYSTSPYATTKNAFYATSATLRGECTWYAYGRVVELAEAGYLDRSMATRMHDAFWGKTKRHARYWPTFLGGEWTPTTSAPLPVEKRKPGMLAVWVGGQFGHVGFVEEISADKTKYRLTDFNRNGSNVGGDGTYKSAWYSFAGTSDRLLGTYPQFYQLPLGTSYEGYLDAANCNTITGWAWNRTQPNVSINVDIYKGTTLLTTVSANNYRSDLPPVTNDGGFHGFSYTTPASLKDGQPHTIRVKYSGTNVDLGNTPKVFTCNATVNPHISVNPSSGPKGTTFTITATGFTPNGTIQEHILKPDGTEYPINIYNADGSGNCTKSWSSANTNIFGTYYIWWVDATIGQPSNTITETVTQPVGCPTTFCIGDVVTVYNTGGVGLRLRQCASTTCSVIVVLPDGNQMTVYGGPVQADGYTWWAISGYVNGVYRAGWAVENYLRK